MKPNKTKILHVVNIPFVIPYFLGNQLNYFSNKGYDEYVISSYDENIEKYALKYNFESKIININRKISIIQDIKAIFYTYKYIRANKIDIVVGHTPKGAMVAMCAAFIARSKKRIYFRHGLVYETSSGLKRFLLMSVDRLSSLLAKKIVCVSPSVAKQSIIDKLNRGKKQIVLSKGTCNGIDISRFNRNSIPKNRIDVLKEKYGINENDYIVGYAGRLVRDKGVIELIEALKQIREQNKLNVKLLLIGMLEERDALPNNIVEYIKTEKSIICTGQIFYEEIQNYYALMNVYILPSYREGFPTSVLEASAMERPVLTTKVTGCIDSIIDNETGLFITHLSNDIANKILSLINDHNLSEMLGKNGREFVVHNFSQQVIWNEIEKLYNN